MERGDSVILDLSLSSRSVPDRQMANIPEHRLHSLSFNLRVKGRVWPLSWNYWKWLTSEQSWKTRSRTLLPLLFCSLRIFIWVKENMCTSLSRLPACYTITEEHPRATRAQFPVPSLNISERDRKNNVLQNRRTTERGKHVMKSLDSHLCSTLLLGFKYTAPSYISIKDAIPSRHQVGHCPPPIYFVVEQCKILNTSRLKISQKLK